MIGLSYLKPGDVVIDVGANVGHFAEQYAKAVGPTGYVLAIEPHPLAFQAAQARATRLPWLVSKQVALADQPGTWPLFCADTDTLRASFWPANIDAVAVSHPVTVTTLDAVVAEMPRPPQFIKIDAQGAEAAILAGADATLKQQVTWVVEIWPYGLTSAGASVADLLRPFWWCGYKPHTPAGEPYAWKALEAEAAAHLGPSSLDVVFCPPVTKG